MPFSSEFKIVCIASIYTKRKRADRKIRVTREMQIVASAAHASKAFCSQTLKYPGRGGMNLFLLGSISGLVKLPSGDAISPLKACTELLIGRQLTGIQNMKPVNFLWEILGYILYTHSRLGGGKTTSEGRKKILRGGL